jgi:predicted TIM-barrel fold metal-dependent hydrolase
VTRVVDAHVHLFGRGDLPREWYRLGGERWAGKKWPTPDPGAIDIEGGLVDDDGTLLMAELERGGADACVAMGLDWGVEFDDPAIDPARVHARFAEMSARHPNRFYGIAGVDPRRPNAVELLTEAVDRYGLKGLKLYPPCGYFPSDPACYPLYERCLELDVPVVIHTAYVGWPHVARFANPIAIGDVQLRHPDLSIVFAHSGHELWLDEAVLTASDHPRSYLELSNWNWNLAGNHEELVRVLVRMRDAVGPHRMLFATDHLGGRRFSGGRSQIGDWIAFVRELPERAGRLGLQVSEEEVELILGANAERVFKL